MVVQGRQACSCKGYVGSDISILDGSDLDPLWYFGKNQENMFFLSFGGST